MLQAWRGRARLKRRIVLTLIPQRDGPAVRPVIFSTPEPRGSYFQPSPVLLSLKGMTLRMKPIIVSRTIHAPLDLVFRTVADVRNFRHAVPHITNVEFLSDQQLGVGTRFRETRLMHGREHTVELEVTEYVENERVRLVSDAGGTIWDTVFSLSPSQADGSAELVMRMDIRPYRLLARIMNALIRGMVTKGVQSDMDAVKAYCEAGGTPGDD